MTSTIVRRSIAVVLCVTFTCGTCLAQFGPNRPWVLKDENGVERRVDYSELHRAAYANDPQAEYLLGKAYEMGTVPDGKRPDTQIAYYWYDRAARAGNLNATYRIGYLIKQGTVRFRDARGRPQTDAAQGEGYMQYALSHGYSPATDSVRPRTLGFGTNDTLRKSQTSSGASTRSAPPKQTESTDDDSGTAFLGLIGAILMLGSDKPEAASDKSTTSNQPVSKPTDQAPYRAKTCTLTTSVSVRNTVPDYRGEYGYHQEFKYSPGYGADCP